jgi:hypothetical protein
MAWATRGHRRYYYRYRKDGGQVLSQYVGTGPAADLAAAVDAYCRAEREARRADDRETERTELARRGPAETPLIKLCSLSDILFRATLLAAGFHQHAGGPWRRKCAERQPSPES